MPYESSDTNNEVDSARFKTRTRATVPQKKKKSRRAYVYTTSRRGAQGNGQDKKGPAILKDG